jgi:hypothetical protein
MSRDRLVPENVEGIASNTEAHASFESDAEALSFFKLASQRLLHVNQWHELAGKATAQFQLRDDEGKAVDREARKGDYFQIDIPAPGSVTGGGYDWVRIEDIVEEENNLVITVRPCSNPQNKDKDTAHFFSSDSSSSFVVKKEGKKVTAGVYGRNEKPNAGTEKIIDKIRNTAVAIGAITGFSKLQWKSLVNGIVKQEE